LLSTSYLLLLISDFRQSRFEDRYMKATMLARLPFRLGLGRVMDAIVIFRPLRPICILVRTRILFCFMYDLDLCMYIWSLDTWSLFGYIIFFCRFHRELVLCYYLDSTRIACMLFVHEALGGVFPKRHRAICGMIAIIRKVPILGHHNVEAASRWRSHQLLIHCRRTSWPQPSQVVAYSLAPVSSYICEQPNQYQIPRCYCDY
jgi:hypothetical protein